jgi:hypothetical protein
MTVAVSELFIGRTDELDEGRAADWESLESTSVVGEVCSSVPWTRAMTRSDGIPQTHLMLYGEGPLAAVSFEIAPTDAPRNYNPPLLLGDAIDGPPLPGVVITTRAGRACDIRLSRNLSASERRQAVESLAEAAEAFAVERGLHSVSFLLLPHAHIDLAEPLASAGYTAETLSSSYFLPLEELDSISDYLAAFPSTQRVKIRREIRRASEPGLAIRWRPLTEALDSHLVLLMLNHKKYDASTPRREHIRERLSLTAEEFGDDAQVAQLSIDGEVIASALYIVYKRTLFGRSIGISSDAPPRLGVYFQLAFYEGIRRGLELGLAQIVYGPDAGATKLSRGCIAEVQDVVYKVVSSDNLVPATTQRVSR